MPTRSPSITIFTVTSDGEKTKPGEDDRLKSIKGETVLENLSAKDQHAIHDLSLRILEEIGIDFLNREAVEILRNRGLRVEGQRVFFSREGVEWATRSVPETFSMHDRMGRSITIGGNNMEFAPCYGSPFVCDGDGVREARVDDYVKMARLVQASEIMNINGGILVQPGELEAQTASLAMFYLVLRLSDKCLFAPSGTPEQLRTMVEMYRIAIEDNGTPNLEAKVLLLANSTSPLRYDTLALNVMMTCARLGQPLILTPGGNAGLTAPVSLFGGTAMGNAEFLAGLMLVQILNEGLPVIYGWPCSAGDMTKGTNASGGVESVAAIELTALMARFYGIPSRTSGAVTNAPVFGPQSAYESMRAMDGNFRYGINLVVHAAGSLDCFNAVSFEKFVTDEENIQSLLWLRQRSYRDMDPDEIIEDIRNIGHGGAFIQSEATLKYFRKALFTPRVSLRGERWDQYEEKFHNAVDRKLQKTLKKYKRPALSDEALLRIRQRAMDGGLSKETLDYLDSQIG